MLNEKILVVLHDWIERHGALEERRKRMRVVFELLTNPSAAARDKVVEMLELGWKLDRIESGTAHFTRHIAKESKWDPNLETESVDLSALKAQASANEPPYLEVAVVEIERRYNKNYGEDRRCQCGHVYYRHFDSYDEMSAIGCKYCDCVTFVEATSEKTS